MAGLWIKIDHDLPDKEEVDVIATSLKIDHDAVVGKLVRLWIWADRQTHDGKSIRVSEGFIDRIANCSGFSAALVESGWLVSRNGRFSLPNFDRHNGQTAKNRALTKDRVKRLRNDAPVTSALPRARAEPEQTSVKKTRGSEGSGVSKKPRLGDLDESVLADLPAYRAWIARERGYRKGLVRSDDDEQFALAAREKAISDSSVNEPIAYVKGMLILKRDEPAKAWSRIETKYVDAAQASKREQARSYHGIEVPLLRDASQL